MNVFPVLNNFTINFIDDSSIFFHGYWIFNCSCLELQVWRPSILNYIWLPCFPLLFFNFLTSTYVESYFTSWKFPTLAICLIIYKWNLTFQRTFRHYFENSTPWMLPAHTWNEEKKKVEVCLSRKTYSHHHNKCSWKESYARFFISLNLLSGVKHSFFIIPNSIYSSYNLS